MALGCWATRARRLASGVAGEVVEGGGVEVRVAGEVQAKVGVVAVGELREQVRGRGGVVGQRGPDVTVGVGDEFFEQVGRARGVAGGELSCVGAGFGEGVEIGGRVLVRGGEGGEVGGGAGVGEGAEGLGREIVMDGGVQADRGIGVGGQPGEGVGGGVGVPGDVAAEGGAVGVGEFVEGGCGGRGVAGGKALGVFAQHDEKSKLGFVERVLERGAGAGEVGGGAGAVEQIEGVGRDAWILRGGAADVKVGVGQELGEQSGCGVWVGGALEAQGGVVGGEGRHGEKDTKELRAGGGVGGGRGPRCL